MLKLENNYLAVSLSELGAEVKSIVYKDTEYMWEGKKEVWGGVSPLLFPICGGLKNDKFSYKGKEYTLQKHGYARFLTFDVENKTENSVTFFHKSNEGTKKCFPFDYELRVTYTLKEKQLSVTYGVKNKTDGEMYFSIGSHEGFATPEGIEDYDVVFPQNETLDSFVLYGNLLSDQRLPIIKDSCVLPLYDKYFTIDALVFKELKSKSCVLRNRKTGRALQVDFPSADYFLLWHKPCAGYICVEPWCGVQDIVGSSYDITEKEGIIKLAKGGEYTCTHTITILE